MKFLPRFLSCTNSDMTSTISAADLISSILFSGIRTLLLSKQHYEQTDFGLKNTHFFSKVLKLKFWVLNL
jgi:hypothetical protein